jgi:nucleoid DNA-binding protein
MANDKMTWTELRKAVAEYANTSEQEAGQFLNALLGGIVEGLKADKQVKIKGLGSFALKAIAPRKSVNIATGEAFTIEGYNKLTFSAESMLKERVEKRLEQPKTEAVMAEINNDPIKKLGEQADEIVDILADLGQAPFCDTPSQSEETTPAEEMVEESIQEEEYEIILDEIGENLAEEEQIEEPKEILPKAEDNTEPAIVPTVIMHPKCLRNCWKWMGWTLLSLVLLGFIGAACYHCNDIIQWWQYRLDCQSTEMEETIITSVEESTPIYAEEEVIDEPEIVIEDVTPTVVPLAEQPRNYTNFIATEVVTYGSRLTWIAYKHYGHKDLWVFIYEANRKQIDNPNYLRMKQEIRVPALNERLLNLSDPEVRKLVDDLIIKYLNK